MKEGWKEARKAGRRKEGRKEGMKKEGRKEGRKERRKEMTRLPVYNIHRIHGSFQELKTVKAVKVSINLDFRKF